MNKENDLKSGFNNKEDLNTAIKLIDVSRQILLDNWKNFTKYLTKMALIIDEDTQIQSETKTAIKLSLEKSDPNNNKQYKSFREKKALIKQSLEILEPVFKFYNESKVYKDWVFGICGMRV